MSILCVLLQNFVIWYLDRAHGKEFSQTFEDSCVKLEEYVHCVEQELKDRAALIESLEEAEVFYDAQYGEAKIVANVRVNELIF